MTIDRFEKMRELIVEADNCGLLKECKDLSGYSGLKLIGALQRIARTQENAGAGHYLEVGVFQGLTLVSVAACLQEVTAFGVDNFSQFDPDGLNQRVVMNRAAANGISNLELLNLDYEDALENLQDYVGDQKIGTYFVDGPHDYRSQLMCLLLAKPFLSPLSVIVVDDCNYRHVRLANRDFLVANPEFKLFFESYTRCHPGNMDPEDVAQARIGWWNGVNVIVRDPENILNTMYPDTYRDRTLFENEHLVQSSKYAEYAPELVSLAQSITSISPILAAKNLVKVFRKRKNIKDCVRNRYRSMDTYSEHLSKNRFNL